MQVRNSNQILFRPWGPQAGATMALYNVFNRIKMLPRGFLGIPFMDATEQNQRFGGPLKLPRLLIPPLAAKYSPVILWEVSQCNGSYRGDSPQGRDKPNLSQVLTFPFLGPPFGQ